MNETFIVDSNTEDCTDDVSESIMEQMMPTKLVSYTWSESAFETVLDHLQYADVTQDVF